MENNWNEDTVSNAGITRTESKAFVANVMLLMTLGLMVSGTLAYLFGNSLELISLLYDLETGGRTILGWIVMLSPLAMIFGLGAAMRKFSAPVVTLMFVVFSALMGMSLSSIFLMFSIQSIFLTFFVSAAMFGVMAVAGYTTKTDLSKFGSIMFMGLIGLIIASLVNWIIGSETMDYIISFFGVLIFTGLTAYDMQKIKQIGATVDANSEDGKKIAVVGALELYLDFINLFLFLLRFFGNRD